MRVHPESGRVETDQERVDRNLQELLGELRVALPGVQVLFAFLLVVPFNQRFGSVTGFHQDKEHIVVVANRLAIVGLSFLAIAMTGAILLVTDVLFGAATTIAATAFVALNFAVLWYALPVRRLLRR